MSKIVKRSWTEAADKAKYFAYLKTTFKPNALTEDQLLQVIDIAENLRFKELNIDACYKEHFAEPKETAANKLAKQLELTKMITAIAREENPELVVLINEAIDSTRLRELYVAVPEFQELYAAPGCRHVDHRKKKRKARAADCDEFEVMTPFARELVVPHMLLNGTPNKYLSMNTAKHFSHYDRQLESGVPSVETMHYNYVQHSLTGIQPTRRDRKKKDPLHINKSVEEYKKNIRTHIPELHANIRPYLLPIYDYVGHVPAVAVEVPMATAVAEEKKRPGRPKKAPSTSVPPPIIDSGAGKSKLAARGRKNKHPRVVEMASESSSPFSHDGDDEGYLFDLNEDTFISSFSKDDFPPATMQVGNKKGLIAVPTSVDAWNGHYHHVSSISSSSYSSGTSDMRSAESYGDITSPDTDEKEEEEEEVHLGFHHTGLVFTHRGRGGC